METEKKRLAGKKISLTGSIPGMDRNGFKTFVSDAGGEYVLNLEAGVDLLVVGDAPLASRLEKARQLSVRTLTWAEFNALVVGQDVSEVPVVRENAVAVGPSLELTDTEVRVLDVTVARRPQGGPRTPAIDSFHHYTLDVGTLQMLRFVASAQALRQPCLLEGETATSKTSAILFLAAMTRHEVVRINLNGQTDTSELMGRYIPNEENVSLPTDALRQHYELLESESRMILRRAQEEGRALTEIESHQVASNERLMAPAWRFQEGLIPQAMRCGWWVILDEMNLAEPQVLERLNSVLERDPTLIVTEGPGTRFGLGGDVPVHPEFRVFATMNPAEYQGRAVLSPAFKDRWVATYQAEPPGEGEYRQFLERAVFGRQPDVTVGGALYSAAELGAGGYESLAKVPALAGFLAKLATLHAGLVEMAAARDGHAAALGASRRERYVFSRRGLLAVLDALRDLQLTDPSSKARVGFVQAPEAIAMEALERVYVSRIRGAEDRGRVLALQRSLGLSRDAWNHRFQEAQTEAAAS